MTDVLEDINICQLFNFLTLFPRAFCAHRDREHRFYLNLKIVYL